MQTAKSIDERAGETHKGRTRVPRTKTTRALALLLALILLGGLVWWTWRKTGNPLIAWYTEQKITAHYRAYHPGEGYVVGPARYQWVVRADKSAGMDYVCTVRKEASEDVEFPAYFSDGAVFSQIDGAVRSGCNTYERFKNLLNSELESGATAARLRALTGEAEVHAGFYTTQEGPLFDPDAPVFRTDEEYDRAGLPLPIELSVSFSAVGAPAPADAELADYLLKTKAVCEETGQPFAYYSVALAFKPTEQKDPVWWAAEHIPSEEITEEKILDYLAVHDIGQAINREICVAQAQGAVVMGSGAALSEHVITRANGRPCGSLKDYHVINSFEAPTVRVEFIEDGETEGPYGAKSIGEVCHTPVTAAVVGAVNDALDSDMNSIPLSPDVITGYLRERMER